MRPIPYESAQNREVTGSSAFADDDSGKPHLFMSPALALGTRRMPDIPIPHLVAVRRIRPYPCHPGRHREGRGLCRHVSHRRAERVVRRESCENPRINRTSPEMSFSTYITLRDQKGAVHRDPVFLSRAFRHSACSACAPTAGSGPADLKGKRGRHARDLHHHAGVDARAPVRRIRHQAVGPALAARPAGTGGWRFCSPPPCGGGPGWGVGRGYGAVLPTPTPTPRSSCQPNPPYTRGTAHFMGDQSRAGPHLWLGGGERKGRTETAAGVEIEESRPTRRSPGRARRRRDRRRVLGAAAIVFPAKPLPTLPRSRGRVGRGWPGCSPTTAPPSRLITARPAPIR